MTLNQLIYFQTIAKYEHFRLAAAELNLSSSHPRMGSSEVDVLTRLLKFPLNLTFFFAKQGSEIVRINIRLPNFLIVSISFCF